MQDPQHQSGVTRHTMELVTAALTGAVGLAVCYGSYQIGIGWQDTGPASGYFPFWIGVLIVVGSAVNFLRAAVLRHHAHEIFLDRGRLKLVASFFLPIVAFAILSVFLGLYVGTVLYITTAMIFQGKYGVVRSIASGLAIAVAFYLIFEIGFQVPLLKGPIEGWFGIY